ncbi:hypothetical protein A4H97_10795 [Niastella yeongjuensis]|uniref:RHS repeat-associated core domain-containing protein n=1 Tax=Niastella yeongjuensis TaxID=354355 RepID=A0A1V9EFC5_9BACT|nr:RHS repeat-associated core domain-containing protein [Niastella yeongjuensis]OQP44839.1 hypothetical protein A4H97_10795 [Niastella yeongjuensis]
MKIAGISSHKLADVGEGDIENKYLYNDKELIDEADLDWYDYGFRNYDAQIGRFTQLDPLTFEYPFLTPYQYASCEPISNIDRDGLKAANPFKDAKILKEVVVVGQRMRKLEASIVHGLAIAAEGLRLGGDRNTGYRGRHGKCEFGRAL